MKNTKTAELSKRIFNAYPNGFFEIVSVNKGHGWRSLSEQFNGFLFGWEKELSSLNLYVNEGYTAIALKVIDKNGYILAKEADFYIF